MDIEVDIGAHEEHIKDMNAEVDSLIGSSHSDAAGILEKSQSI